MTQKNELMKLYIKNGVTSLDAMAKHFNQYANGGPKKTYKEWKQAMTQKYPYLELDSDKAGYDYERYFNENYDDAVARLTETEARHFTDKYKLPHHLTFSNESLYSQSPSIGGEWVEDSEMYNKIWSKGSMFKPSVQSTESMFVPSVINRQQYPRVYDEDRAYTEEEIYKKYNDSHFGYGGDVPSWFGRTARNMFGSTGNTAENMFGKAFRKYRKENQTYIGKPLETVEVTAGRLPEATVTDDNVRNYADYVSKGIIGLSDIPNIKLRRAVQVKGFQNDWQKSMADVTPKFLAGLAAVPTAVIGANYLPALVSNPAVQTMARQLLASEIGGRGVDLASQAVTGNTWNNNVGNLVQYATGWNPTSTWWGDMLTSFTNPGYMGLEGAKQVGKAVKPAMNRVGSKLKSFKTWYNSPQISDYNFGFPMESPKERVRNIFSPSYYKEIFNPQTYNNVVKEVVDFHNMYRVPRINSSFGSNVLDYAFSDFKVGAHLPVQYSRLNNNMNIGETFINPVGISYPFKFGFDTTGVNTGDHSYLRMLAPEYIGRNPKYFKAVAAHEVQHAMQPKKIIEPSEWGLSFYYDGPYYKPNKAHPEYDNMKKVFDPKEYKPDFIDYTRELFNSPAFKKPDFTNVKARKDEYLSWFKSPDELDAEMARFRLLSGNNIPLIQMPQNLQNQAVEAMTKRFRIKEENKEPFRNLMFRLSNMGYFKNGGSLRHSLKLCI